MRARKERAALIPVAPGERPAQVSDTKSRQEPEANAVKGTTTATAASTFARTFRYLPALLYLVACACFIDAVVELPEHVMHAALWIVAGAVLWLVGEVAS